MIYIVTGKPGSGKTYLLIKILTDTYYKKNKDGQWEYRLNPENNKPYQVVTNIDGLLLPHVKLDEAIQKSKKTVQKFFYYDYQKTLMELFPNTIYVIDECQQYFDKKMNDTQTLLFFEQHRHLGIDVYLLAQTYKRINPNIQGLEYQHYHAANRLMSLTGEFHYSVGDEHDKLEHKIVMKNKELFALYKSRERKELSTKRNPLIKYIVVAILFGLVSFIVLKKTFFNTAKANIDKVQKFDKNQLNQKSQNPQTQVIEQKPRKYFYRLSLISYTDQFGKERYLYNDYEDNQLLPIEILEEPIITMNNKGFVIKYVVCTYPNQRFIPPISLAKVNKVEKESQSAFE